MMAWITAVRWKGRFPHKSNNSGSIKDGNMKLVSIVFALLGFIYVPYFIKIDTIELKNLWEMSHGMTHDSSFTDLTDGYT